MNPVSTASLCSGEPVSLQQKTTIWIGLTGTWIPSTSDVQTIVKSSGLSHHLPHVRTMSDFCGITAP